MITTIICNIFTIESNKIILARVGFDTVTIYTQAQHNNPGAGSMVDVFFVPFQQIDDCRRTHNYDEFICTFLSMLAQQGKLADLVQQHLVQHKKPGLPVPRVQRFVIQNVVLSK
jgi:hypothetical protein